MVVEPAVGEVVALGVWLTEAVGTAVGLAVGPPPLQAASKARVSSVVRAATLRKRWVLPVNLLPGSVEFICSEPVGVLLRSEDCRRKMLRQDPILKQGGPTRKRGRPI